MSSNSIPRIKLNKLYRLIDDIQYKCTYILNPDLHIMDANINIYNRFGLDGESFLWLSDTFNIYWAPRFPL